jgi:hypothetical protein
MPLATEGSRRKASGWRQSRLRRHRSSLPAGDTSVRSGIPVTTPARTIADLKRGVPAVTLRKAIREAEFRGLDVGDADTDHTRSELERAFLRLSRRYHMPESEVNVRVAGFTVDFLWREQSLAVETDGYERTAAGRRSRMIASVSSRSGCSGCAGSRIARFTASRRGSPRQFARPFATEAD